MQSRLKMEVEKKKKKPKKLVRTTHIRKKPISYTLLDDGVMKLHFSIVPSCAIERRAIETRLGRDKKKTTKICRSVAPGICVIRQFERHSLPRRF